MADVGRLVGFITRRISSTYRPTVRVVTSVADETLSAITTFIDFVAMSPYGQLEHCSNFGTFGVAGHRSISGRTCALLVDTDGATFAVKVLPAADLPDVQSSAGPSVLLVTFSARARRSSNVTLDLVGRVTVGCLVIADIAGRTTRPAEELVIGL
jgi:hypothetical protein